MHYLLYLPPTDTRHKVEQVKAYLSAIHSPNNPLHDVVKEEEGCRLARSKSWLGQVEQTTQHVCGLTELKQVRDWEKRLVDYTPNYKTLLLENPGTHCHKWPSGKPVQKVNACRSHQQATFFDLHRWLSHEGPVQLGFTIEQGGRTMHKDRGAYRGAYRVTTSSLTTKVEAVTHAVQWLASQCDAQITHSIILTDSLDLLWKVESGIGCAAWHTVMHSLWL